MIKYNLKMEKSKALKKVCKQCQENIWDNSSVTNIVCSSKCKNFVKKMTTNNYAILSV